MRILERLMMFIQRHHVSDNTAISKAYDLFANGLTSFSVAKELCTEAYYDKYVKFHPMTLLAYMNTHKSKITQEALVIDAWKNSRLFRDFVITDYVDVALFLADLFTISNLKGAGWLWLLSGFERILNDPIGKELFKIYPLFMESCMKRMELASKDPFLHSYQDEMEHVYRLLQAK